MLLTHVVIVVLIVPILGHISRRRGFSGRHGACLERRGALATKWTACRGRDAERTIDEVANQARTTVVEAVVI